MVIELHSMELGLSTHSIHANHEGCMVKIALEVCGLGLDFFGKPIS